MSCLTGMGCLTSMGDPLSAASLVTAGLNFIVGDSGKAQASLVLQQQAQARRNLYIGGGLVLGAALLALVFSRRS